MRFRITNEPWVLRGYIPEFIALIGASLWDKRTSEIRRAGLSSPYRERIASDYHWLELQIADEMTVRATSGAFPNVGTNPISARALRFCQTVVEVDAVLSVRGQKALRGRLRDALQAHTGFASVYQEMELVAQLVADQYDVSFPDLEGVGNADLLFQKGNCTGAIECKALSADAGRKIHRKGFYEFMHAVAPSLSERASNSDTDEVIAITLSDRLPAVASERDTLLAATKDLIRTPGVSTLNGRDFEISRSSYSEVFENSEVSEQHFRQTAQRKFGPNCHIAGMQMGPGRSLVIMHSKRPDDPSGAQLDAMKKAAIQLPRDRPGFIALQHGEINSTDLTLPHFRDKSALLAGHLFLQTDAGHVSGVYVSAFGSVSVGADALGYAGLLIRNPTCRMQNDQLPFKAGRSMDAFQQILSHEITSCTRQTV